jgi:DNA-binding PadR family transcriptional regulator
MHRHHRHEHQYDHGCRHGDARGEARGDDRRYARGERDGRHWHRGGRGGLGRFFAHGDLRLVILNLIAEKPRHGYEIIKAIEDQVGGAYSPSPGVIYPTLTLLEELGYVTVQTSADSAKKLHEITGEGKAFLEANRETLQALLARMAEASRAAGDGPAPQVVRAMENLRLALRMRMSRGPLSIEQATAVAAALDAATIAVEKI